MTGIAERGMRRARRVIPLVVRAALRRAEEFLSRTVQGMFRGRGLSAAGPAGRRHALARLPRCRFVGYADGNLGLGQALREDFMAALEAGVPVSILPFQLGIETRLTAPFMPQHRDAQGAYAVNVVVVSPDYVPHAFAAIPKDVMAGSYTILRAYWELSRAPEHWRSVLSGIDEVWAPNDFVAGAFANVFDGPVRIVPTPVDVGAAQAFSRAAFGMEEGRFYFLYSFDYASSPHRKNPLGVLHAFRRAFGDGRENVGLVLKSIGQREEHAAIAGEIEAAAAADPRIVLMDRTLDRADMLGLMAACDSFVSLHRAEGFGIGMAEAMRLGKIVIGTDFSGSRCFLDATTGYPVPFSLRPVEPHEYPWAAGQVWAEPDVAEAARIMRHVLACPDEARRRAEAGRSAVEAGFGRAAVGKAIRDRLAELGPAPGRLSP